MGLFVVGNFLMGLMFGAEPLVKVAMMQVKMAIAVLIRVQLSRCQWAWSHQMNRGKKRRAQIEWAMST